MAGRDIVLLHGAWHGGWCWAGVAGRLARQGHRVSAPTLPGLGERAHELSPSTSIELFVADVAAHVEARAARTPVRDDDARIVLVGHSFAGTILSALAERMPERLGRLVYLDALIVEAGVSPFDQFTPAVQASRRRRAEETSGGLSLPPPPPSALGISDDALAAEVAPRLTPHPFRTFTDPAPFSCAVGNGLDCVYVRCIEPVYSPLAASRAWAEAAGWPIEDLASGHDCMLISPDETAALIGRLAGGMS